MSVGTIDQLISVCEQMRDAGIIGKYAIGGAFAATLLDEPIATADVDIFFLFSKESSSLVLDMSPLYNFAEEQGFTFDHEFINIHGWLVQFVESGMDPLWLDAIESPRLIPVGKVAVPVIKPNFLVLMWLSAGRPKDYEKIARFVDAGLVTERDFSIVDQYGLTVEWEKVKDRFFSK